MKVIKLNSNPLTYSCNAYLLLGDWNTIDDMNTVIDTGADGYLISQIESINTGLGKVPVDQVIITHNHFDHTGGLKSLVANYKPKIYSALNVEGAETNILKHNQEIKIAEGWCRVIHTPGHSTDSICIYCEKNGILFTGDTTIHIHTDDGTYTKDYVQSLKLLAELDVKIVYPGHGSPISSNPKEMIKNTLKIVRNSHII